MANNSFAATTLYMRNSKNTAIGVYRDILTTNADSGYSNSYTTATDNGDNIQLTVTQGGESLEWISGQIPAGGVTISGAITFKVTSWEGSPVINAGIRARLYKYSGGTLYEMGGGPFDKATELSFFPTSDTWTGTPTSNNVLAEDDRIVVRFYMYNNPAWGAMIGGFGDIGIMFNGPPAETSEAYASFTESFTPKTEPVSGTSLPQILHAIGYN